MLVRIRAHLENWSDHDDVIKWKHFQHYWPFVRGIHRWPVNSPHKGQWRGALMFSLICAWINAWVNNREAGDLQCHHAHCDVTVMCLSKPMGPSKVNLLLCQYKAKLQWKGTKWHKLILPKMIITMLLIVWCCISPVAGNMILQKKKCVSGVTTFPWDQRVKDRSVWVFLCFVYM